MLQQKIVMEVLMQNEKYRTKAMKIAAVAEGVMSVALEGPENDRMVVVGVGIDSATLARSLSKRVGLTSFVSITEVKPEDGKKKKHDIHECSSCASFSTTSATTWGYPVTSASAYSIEASAPPYSGYDHLAGYSIDSYAPPYSGYDHLAGYSIEASAPPYSGYDHLAGYSIDSYARPYSGNDHLAGYSVDTYAPPYSGHDHLGGLNSETPSICSIM
ncbi:unnamed protein product [Rhodiola kirilowii]